MGLGICKNCKKEKDIRLSGKSKGLCNWCYRKLLWVPELIICKRCKRQMKHQAKGFCPGCYNSIFHLDNVKKHNARKYHNITPELYQKITNQCNVCGFNKIVEAHHLDHNKQNNSETNLVGLCPNCHKMLHSKVYQKEIFDALKIKGFSVPKGYDFDGFFKK